MSILHEEIKNTRFILTLVAVGMVGVLTMGVLGLIYLSMTSSVAVDSALLAVFTTIVGAIVGIVATTYNSYFKDRAAQAAVASEDVEAVEAPVAA